MIVHNLCHHYSPSIDFPLNVNNIYKYETIINVLPVFQYIGRVISAHHAHNTRDVFRT